jgi:hypothetical protein
MKSKTAKFKLGGILPKQLFSFISNLSNKNRIDIVTCSLQLIFYRIILFFSPISIDQTDN